MDHGIGNLWDGTCKGPDKPTPDLSLVLRGREESAKCGGRLVTLPGSGQVFEGIYAGQRCRCHKRTSAFIHPKMYTRLEIFPKGISCQREEVIITLLSGKMVCVEPDAKWLKTILGYLDRKKKRHERSK
ncbi:hypothetical protein NDU88_000460 [Pleurodeles waltl]|uniref:Chemokine interleukin-8-like domain-containing protein n=1 Tax=Pleurodeles waltl TaxID=8319 RepID=A0AAV7VTJ1_PLEWA|nr:hypothetical protein NDU88_000460 [Pleurodeles waltl]